MCFVGDETVEFVRLSRLDWGFAAERLDTYIVKGVLKTFQASAERAPVERRQNRRAPNQAGPDDDFDILADLGMPRRRPAPARPVVVEAAEEFDPLQELLREAPDEADKDAEPRQEELEDLNLDALFAEENEAADQASDAAPSAQPDHGTQAPVAAAAAAASATTPAPLPTLPDDLPIYDAGSWHFLMKSDNSAVGRIHHIASATSASLKCTCRKHKGCSFMVSMPPALSDRLFQVSQRLHRAPLLEDLEHDMIMWLAAGVTMTAAEHEAASRSLRSERWSVRVRARARADQNP